MSKIQDAVALAKQWAADPTHGYDQANRWGPNYDCSSFIITVLEQCGIKVKSAGATYTGNMRAVFQRCGFEVISLWTMQSLLPGDVLLNEANHTAMYIGDGKLVQARSNENGGITGGKSGDQTGQEIAVGAYYNFPWDCVLRYVGGEKEETMSNTYTVKSGDSWWSIADRELGDGGLMYQLAELNGKTVYDTIYPGQVLKLWDDECESCKVDLPATDPGDMNLLFYTLREQVEKTVELLGGSVNWNY